MNRSEFLRRSCQWLGATATGLMFAKVARGDDVAPPPAASLEKELARSKGENEFVNNWLTDLFDTIETEVDPAVRVKLLEGCGRGCFRRHEFKRAIAGEGQGDIDKLIAAYRKNFEIWREGDFVHIRYGETSPGCYCPAANHRPPRPGDLHCECTRMTHQTIFETALGRPFKVEVLESVRRGQKTCHFLVHLQPAAAA